MNDVFEQLAQCLTARLKADWDSQVHVMETLTVTINKHIEAMKSMTDTLVGCVQKLEEAGVFKKPVQPEDDDGLIN